MSNIMIAALVLAVIVSLGMNLVQYAAHVVLKDTITSLVERNQQLKERVCRSELFHYLVQQAETRFQEDYNQ